MFIWVHRSQKCLVSTSSTEIVSFLLEWVELGQVSEILGSSPASGTWQWLWPSVSSSRNSFNRRHPTFFSGLFIQLINRPDTALCGSRCASTKDSALSPAPWNVQASGEAAGLIFLIEPRDWTGKISIYTNHAHTMHPEYREMTEPVPVEFP